MVHPFKKIPVLCVCVCAWMLCVCVCVTVGPYLGVLCIPQIVIISNVVCSSLHWGINNNKSRIALFELAFQGGGPAIDLPRNRPIHFVGNLDLCVGGQPPNGEKSFDLNMH